MKTFFTTFSKFDRPLFVLAALLALCSMFVPASPPTVQTEMEKSPNEIMVIGSPSAGVTAALTAKLAQHGIEAMFIALDETDVLTREIPIIAIKHDILPIATAAQNKPLIQLKTETPKSVSGNFSQPSLYDVPPDVRGFSGQTFANPIRARPQNA